MSEAIARGERSEVVLLRGSRLASDHVDRYGGPSGQAPLATTPSKEDGMSDWERGVAFGMFLGLLVAMALVWILPVLW